MDREQNHWKPSNYFLIGNEQISIAVSSMSEKKKKKNTNIHVIK